MTSVFRHTPIMKNEVLELLAPERGGIFADGTLGGGGHAEAVLERLPENGKLYGIDRDGDAIAAASKKLERFGSRFKSVRGNFFDMRSLLSAEGVCGLDGALLDLGVSSYQLDTPERGFSYNEDAPLDMRMDRSASMSAYDVVNTYSADRLAEIIRDYGEERYAARIARRIAAEREKAPIETTLQLAGLIKEAMPAASRNEKQHPAKRTFQAIRIEVNGELEELDAAISDIESFLNPGGVLAVITFHSLEDRIVKQAFKRFEEPCICDRRAPICTCGLKPTAKIITKKPLTASEEELEANPRSRSAKLRAIRRL